MDALTTSLLVAVAVFLSSLVGLSLHRVVPEGHLSQETRSVILLGTGTLSLLASLVLGLLVRRLWGHGREFCSRCWSE